MTTKVYRFGLRPPTRGSDRVRDQIRAAHDYRNDLVAIERGRREALRAVDATEEVAAAEAVVRAATKSTRRDAIRALREARKRARSAAADELARISSLDEQIRRDARALTSCYWGSYLAIEAAHQQSRAQPLYGDDAVTPNDPAFVRVQATRWRTLARRGEHDLTLPAEGQVGVQLQGGLRVRDALACTDSRMRISLGPRPNARGDRFGLLWLRVGSEGREPVWATFPIRMHRMMPDDGVITWARASVRRRGSWRGDGEEWTCEITVRDAAEAPRDRDRELSGAIAAEWEWTHRDDGSICVARWCDDRGGDGEVVLPAEMASRIRKPDGLRAVRDLVLNDLRPKLIKAIAGAAHPAWLLEAKATLHLWRSPDRFHGLRKRWLLEGYDGARAAFVLLDEWHVRDEHLYDYESGVRSKSLRRRLDLYRQIASRWSRTYRYALLSDQDLSFAARRLDDSDVRFTAGVAELRQCVRDAFGVDAIDARWRDGAGDGDEMPWCERTRDAWIAGAARGDGRFAKTKEKTGNAWAKRKSSKTVRAKESTTAREPSTKCAET